jgi:hypothetical protein
MISQRVVRKIDHMILLWTVYYKNSCLVYKADKEGSGWYLRKLGSKKVISWEEPPK